MHRLGWKIGQVADVDALQLQCRLKMPYRGMTYLLLS